MISSILKMIFSVLFIFCAITAAQSQTAPTKEQTSSISGKVTVGGKGISGVFVGTRPRESRNWQAARYGSTTDPQGNYRISNVPPGTYEVMPTAPQFVVAGQQAMQILMIVEGETVENVDFTLVRGGVITGRVTDAEGQPLIEEQVAFVLEEFKPDEPMHRMMPSVSQTDDRGVYRIFGLPPGRYKVSVGLRADQLHLGSVRRAYYKQTFHPSAADPSKATVIEVTEGSEATNVDITVSRTQTMFTVSGRIVDGDTGRPVPNVRYGIEKYRENGSSGMSGSSSNGLGEFKLENVTPGKYAVYIERQPTSQIHAEPVMFEVTDQNITDLVLKTSTGATISGSIVFDGDNKIAGRKFDNVTIFAYVVREGTQHATGSSAWATVKPDGSFTVGGLPRGLAQFTIRSAGSGTHKEFQIARIERDGVVQPRGLEIKDREHVGGVHLVINNSIGAIRGIVKIENGPLPPTAYLHVVVSRVGEKQGSMPAPGVDSRGRFLVEGLSAGVYEVRATVYLPNGRKQPPSAKQQVIVVEDQVAEVSVTLDLSPGPEPNDNP
jgi:hypothetical protein